jgi:hypothetical protein
MSCSAFRLSLDVLRICEVALYGILIASAERPVVTSIVARLPGACGASV